MAKWSSFVWGDGTKWGHAAADYPHRVPLTIKIAGTDRTDSIDPATVLIEEIATKQDSRASFIIKNGGSMNLAELDAVIIAGWEQEHEFAGYIWKLEELARGVQLDYRVDCTDYTWDLKHPEALVDEKYTSKSDQYIIQDFMATSCPGIEVSAYVEEVNSDTGHMSFDNDTAFEVIERLAENAGAEWYVDFGPVAGDPTKWAYLHYFDSGTNAAPYSLSDSPDLSASFPYKNLSEFVEAPLANKVVVIGRDLAVTRTRGAEADYGRWLVAKLVNLDITTTAQANSVGDQFLTEVAATASYRLDAHEPGLRAGQNVTLVNSLRSINTSFMIMSLSKRFDRAGLTAYTVQLGKYIPSLAAIIVRDSEAGGLTGTIVADAIKADLAVFDELLLYLDEGEPALSFNIDEDDAVIIFRTGDIDRFCLGVDGTDGLFKINTGGALEDFSVFEIDVEGHIISRGGTIQIDMYSTNITYAGMLAFTKSHNETVGTKTETIDNDTLGAIGFYGVDTGGNRIAGTLIEVLQDGNAGPGYVPAEILFTTYDWAGNANQPITIDSSGNLDIHGRQELRLYSDGYYSGLHAGPLGASQTWTLPLADGTANQLLTTDGSGTLSWSGGGSGGIGGPASSTDNAVARWNGTGGNALQDSSMTITDSCVATLAADSTKPQAELHLATYNAAITNLSVLRFQKSHNDTLGTKTETVDNDPLGAINFFGIDTGSNADFGAQILGIQNGSAGTTIPTDLEFHCYDDSGVDYEYRMSRYGWFYIEVPAGDPLVIYSIDNSAKFATGVDDDDSDKFKINSGGSLADESSFELDSQGNLRIEGTFRINQVQTGHDATITFEENDTDHWVIGVDATTDDKFKINAGGPLGNYSDFELGGDAQLELISGGTSTRPILSLTGYNDQSLATCQSELRFRKSHSDTLGTLATTQAGEELGAIRFYGIDTNNAWTQGAYIQGRQHLAAGANSIPGNLDIFAFNSVEVRADDGNLTLFGWEYVYITASSYDVQITGDTIDITGDVDITGALTKSSGSFKIDHPLDPKNKWLYHSIVESPDMMNIYNANVILDENGKAIVELPKWFVALNRDFRYQLTPIDQAMPGLYISQEVQDNAFEIAGGVPSGRASWQITGVRQDRWANEHRIQVEVDKED